MSFLGMVNNDGADRPVGSTLYGTCTSLSSEPDKYVTLPDFDALLEGMTIHVLFRYSNAVAGTEETPITLNVNGVGAKPIYTDATNFPGVTPATSWQANSVVSFTYDGDAWRMNDLGANKGAIVDMIYPIGSIYMSVNSTNPGTLFGGGWEQLQDRFLLAAGTSHSAGSTGGAETHTIAESNLPSHSHVVGEHSHTMAHTHTGPSHSHGLNNHTHSIPALSGTAASNGNHSHSLSKQTVVSGGTSVSVIGAASASCSWEAASTNSTGAHTHTVSTTASTTGGNTGSTAAAGTGNTGGSSAANTGSKAAFNTSAVGSGTALDTMPPYLAVYVWKRVS